MIAMKTMMKQLLLTVSDAKFLLEKLKDTDCSLDLIDKLEKISNQEAKEKYVVQKGIILQTAYMLKCEEWADDPLDYRYITKEVKKLSDYSRTLYNAVDGRYIIQLKKDGRVFKFRWEAKLAGLERHKSQLLKRLEKIKSVDIRDKINNKLNVIEKNINYIHDNPEKLLKQM